MEGIEEKGDEPFDNQNTVRQLMINGSDPVKTNLKPNEPK